MTHLPIVCTLGSAERRHRREGVLRELFAQVAESQPLENGYAFRFVPKEGLVAEIARMIELESGCCAFLSFDLRVIAGGGPVWLTLTGPPGTKEFLETEIVHPVVQIVGGRMA